MEVKRRFSPFGIALFAALLIGLLFFAFLMSERGDAPNGDAPDGGMTGTTTQEALIPPGQ